MNNNDYAKLIQQIIPNAFSNIYIIDIMADLVMDYGFENDGFNCKATTPFTTFFSDLEQCIHPEDLKGYVDNISPNNLQDNMENGIDLIRYEYRRKLDNGNYDWYTNIIKLIEVDNRKVALVLVENINENIQLNDGNNNENIQQKQKILFDAVSNAIIKLNSVTNINQSNTNLEIKGISDYINNIVLELTSSFPELNEAITNNMIDSANQGTTRTLLVVDDDQMTCKLLAKTFEDSYKVVIANNGQDAIEILKNNFNPTNLERKERIVGMFLDLNMPVVDGFGVLDYMSSKNLLKKMPIIIISGDYDQATKDKAYMYPISDVLEKPFNVQVVKHRIKTFVKLYRANNSLNEMMLTQNQEIRNVIKTMIESYLYDNADDIHHVTNYMGIIARQLDADYQEYNFDNNRINIMLDAARYYNIGLYTLPHKMLKKKNFTLDEVEKIKRAPSVGVAMFEGALYRSTDSVFNHFTKDIIEYHQEHFDGTGYPHGLKANNIPTSAQIASIAIEYNELSKIMDEDSVVDAINKASGTKFNPKIVNSLKRCIDKLRAINANN